MVHTEFAHTLVNAELSTVRIEFALAGWLVGLLSWDELILRRDELGNPANSPGMN